MAIYRRKELPLKIMRCMIFRNIAFIIIGKKIYEKDFICN